MPKIKWFLFQFHNPKHTQAMYNFIDHKAIICIGFRSLRVNCLFDYKLHLNPICIHLYVTMGWLYG